MLKYKDVKYSRTLHALMHDLEEYLNLTPEQKFRVAAKIKRYVHSEKSDFSYRMHEYCRGPGIYEGEGDSRHKVGEDPPLDQFISDTLKGKAISHSEWAGFPDEEVLTYDIGSHIFIQKRHLCCECQTDLYGEESLKKLGGVLTTHNKGILTYYCRPCAEKNGKWADWQKKNYENN